MPQRGRLDAPGALQHVMIRPIKRRNILRDNPDREEFLARLMRQSGAGKARLEYEGERPT
jgi:hypothetical protein